VLFLNLFYAYICNNEATLPKLYPSNLYIYIYIYTYLCWTNLQSLYSKIWGRRKEEEKTITKSSLEHSDASASDDDYLQFSIKLLRIPILIEDLELTSSIVFHHVSKRGRSITIKQI
jgi:hypothetical protein